ncbi:hypothetical protein [Hyphomicrobium sp. LHD-15]|uniref:hypothetical protein n=1 Tax=Hyphomicrobium sp. LHD-15 TaxID=3072142 RepID=UPI00280DD546|nr:hypothetical protein [Hyphomicrobium sp. LHD-15]MDQ8699261.1 hypothetical protein [Hyphomicrobium sp. LHD-15]
MSVAPHYGARLQFLSVLDDFFARGCQRWQRKEFGWLSADELPAGVAAGELLINRFVREECGEAAYRFRGDLRRGANSKRDVALKSRLVFDQFVVRAQRLPAYFRAEEVDDLKRFFEQQYWPIEEAWLQGRREEDARSKLFADIGGPRAVAAIKTDVQSFYTWSQNVITEAYYANDYQRALQVAEAVVMEAASQVARDFDDNDVVLGLCAVQEAASVATMVRLNCWADEPAGFLTHLDDVARRRIKPAMLTGPAPHDLGRFATIATVLKAACRRFDNPDAGQASLVAIYNMLGYLSFHLGIRAGVATETRAPVDSTTITLLLSEAVNLRADWLRAFGLYGRMRQVPEFTERARTQLSTALGADEQPGLVKATLAFMAEPHQLIEDEWAAIEAKEASTTGWNDVALAVVGAKVWLHHDVIDLSNSYTWLQRAKQTLSDCSVHLAWSDFYTTCDAYMQERGQPTLCDYALNSVRKLQRRAGNKSAEQHFEAGVLKAASRRKRKPPPGKGPDDMELQWFLREEPVSLSGRR